MQKTIVSERVLLAFLVVIVVFLSTRSMPIYGETGDGILPMKARAEIIDQLLATRLQKLPAKLMRSEGIAMWVLIAREYNEDPVVKTMLPGTAFAARRRTILVFVDEGANGVKGYAVSRYGVGDFFKAVWNPDEQKDQWRALADFIAEKNPKNIGINVSPTFALADGLTHGEHMGFISALPEKFKKRVVPAEKLAVSWLETRTREEMAVYPSIVKIAHDIIAEGFSNKVVTPGITTTDDVRWWYRDRIRELRLQTWFHPSVGVQRSGSDVTKGKILPGDLLHVDFGIIYLRLNTDTQQHAYVLRSGETQAPAGLVAGLKTSNRLQDILISKFKVGRTGNQILKAARLQALDEGMRPSIYTHPIGYHGHAAGPTIGMWDNQGDTVGRGDYPMYANTAYSIELNTTVSVPEWGGQDVKFKLEEDAFFDGKSTGYIDGRQQAFLLIKSD